MSNHNKESLLHKIKRWIGERQAKVEIANSKDIPISSQKSSIIVHVFFISLIFLIAQTKMYNNWLELFMCFYLTAALICMAHYYRYKTHVPTQKATKTILLSTVVGLGLGFAIYHTPIGESLEKKQIDSFFEKNKAFIGQKYYDIYVKNKDNSYELKILRKRIHDDLAL